METFPSTPTPQYPLEVTSEFKTLKSDFETGREQRRSIWTFPRRQIKLSFDVLKQADIDTLWNFYQARKGGYEPFYFFDLFAGSHAGEYVGRGDGSQVIFELPSKETTTRGSDLVTNGGFDSDTSGWTALDSATLESVSGGVSGNCLKVTAGAANSRAQQTITVEPETVYELDFFYKNTSGDTAKFGVYNNSGAGWIKAFSSLADNTSWTWKTCFFKTPAGCTSIEVAIGASANTDIVFFDTVKLRKNSLSVFVNGTLTDYSFSQGTGNGGVDRITFFDAPANGSMITADLTGLLRYRVCFHEDSMSKELFRVRLYKTGLELREARV